MMPQTIGQKLKQAREEQRLTLEKAFEATRIRIPYLQALEADDLSVMPSPVQARGYLRNYVKYLGLNFEQLLDEMRAVQRLSDEIIGPADLTDQPAAQTPEAQPAQGTATLSTLESEASTQAESQPAPSDPVPVPEEVLVLKPKSSRRKKNVSQPQADSVSIPKRRGRKKAEPDPAPESAPEPVIEPPPQIIEEPAVSIKSEPVVEEVIAPTQEETPRAGNVSDSLWQKWLSRLSSVTSVSARRGASTSEKNLDALSAESDIAPEEENPQEQEEVQNLPSTESSEIFKEIGIELRKRRELLSLHLDEVERNTRVKAHYLEALEKGAMDDLPSTVQTRGMLSNYATFLDLDVDALLLRFADALQARHRERNPQKPARKPGQPILGNIPSIRSFIAGDVIFGIGIAILLVGFSVWGVNRVMITQSQREVQPTSPSISDVLLASPDPSSITATATLQPIGSIPGEATVTIVIPTLNVNADVQINLVAVERTYMRVTVDGKTVFDGRVVSGNAYPFEAEDQIEVLVGSGAAIRVVYNGRDLGLMGAFGQVVDNIYTADEIITPTTLPSPTITNTVEPTHTASPTSTLKPTLTLVPSSTSAP